ncbi:MAG: hypothetical protein R3Y26_00290 [Rikenellaceae bacterium]
MKKYDFALLSLYVVIVVSVFSYQRYIHNMKQQTKDMFLEVTNNQDITSIVIDNITERMEIFYTQETDSDTWKIQGFVNQHNIDDLYIENGVLHIKNIKYGRLKQLKVNRNIPIEINNSPKVVILSDEELANKLTNKKTKRTYEF